MSISPKIVVIILTALLFTGCGSAESNPPLTIEQIQLLETASTNPIQLQGELSEMFAFGSKHTDLQRDIMRGKLVGSIVQWKLPVYEVSLSNGVYKVQTKGGVRIGQKGMDLMTVIIYISPRIAEDQRTMELLKTGDMISFRGKVSEIMFRSFVIINPAILIRLKGS